MKKAISKKDILIIRTSQICKLFSVTSVTIGDWCKRGMPKISRGKFDLYLCFAWHGANIKPLSQESDDPEIQESQKKYWKEHARAEKIKNDEKMNLLVNAEDVRRDGYAAGAIVKEGLYQMVEQLAPELTGTNDMHEIKQILTNSNFNVLTNFSEKLKNMSDRMGGD
ncbi:MAG: hypothetical protein KAI50_03935 [Desulfobacterales bacterium]|nr:hypothetical protein [Desulfobacterales bacterium]